MPDYVFSTPYNLVLNPTYVHGKNRIKQLTGFLIYTSCVSVFLWLAP